MRPRPIVAAGESIEELIPVRVFCPVFSSDVIGELCCLDTLLDQKPTAISCTGRANDSFPRRPFVGCGITDRVAYDG